MASAFKNAVEAATKTASELAVEMINNEYNLKQLQKAKERGEIPPFLNVRLTKMRWLPENRATALDRSFQERARRMSLENLDELIASRTE